MLLVINLTLIYIQTYLHYTILFIILISTLVRAVTVRTAAGTRVSVRAGATTTTNITPRTTTYYCGLTTTAVACLFVPTIVIA